MIWTHEQLYPKNKEQHKFELLSSPQYPMDALLVKTSPDIHQIILLYDKDFFIEGKTLTLVAGDATVLIYLARFDIWYNADINEDRRT